MFSTSQEVCELWNSHEIVRVMGEGLMREFIILLPEDGKMEGRTRTHRVRLIPTRNSDQELVEMTLNHSNNKSPEKYDQSLYPPVSRLPSFVSEGTMVCLAVCTVQLSSPGLGQQV
ncbi:hypothetical protein BKA56DRAFT_592658 [Ilyonectria sp. MPI-CAGE-AT-0026]|nr:hypothetical protein BKA56DRAFT_592658 [Ilyonectria sp. MPI-CAGE-AT-0026]